MATESGTALTPAVPAGATRWRILRSRRSASHAAATGRTGAVTVASAAADASDGGARTVAVTIALAWHLAIGLPALLGAWPELAAPAVVAAGWLVTAGVGVATGVRLLRGGSPPARRLAAVLLVVDATVLGLPLRPTLILLFASTASLGLVAGNATGLATDEASGAAGTGSAVMGALQFALGAAVSPVVGLAGEFSAVPMAVTMMVVALLAAGSLGLARTRS